MSLFVLWLLPPVLQVLLNQQQVMHITNHWLKGREEKSQCWQHVSDCLLFLSYTSISPFVPLFHLVIVTVSNEIINSAKKMKRLRQIKVM